MQADLNRGKVAFRIRGVGLSAAILASATVSLYAPDRALAACGSGSHPAGVHAAASGTGGTHAATSTVATSGGSGGGSGTLGCAGGSSGSPLRGLPLASSGRVMEPGAHAARTETHARTATTRTANAATQMRGVGHAHRI
jgi:hypothetical protein